MSSMLPPEIVIESSVTVITLGPDYVNLDEARLDGIRDALLEVPRTAELPLVVLDLSHTKFFGSSFIEVLFRLWKRVSARQGGQFAISGLTPYCAEVLAITHLDTLWRTFPSRGEAIRALKPGASEALRSLD